VAERKYTASHEWIVDEDGTATIGISDFAQAQLGDVVFLELPKPGTKVSAG
jgi:glycine cleavage system H protein